MGSTQIIAASSAKNRIDSTLELYYFAYRLNNIAYSLFEYVY